jgi:hypothetical protein
VQASKSKSALPVLKGSSASSKTSTTAEVATAVNDDRRPDRLASISESPPRQEVHRTPGAASGAVVEHVSHTEASEAAMTMPPVNAGAGSHQHQQYPALPSLVPLIPSSQTLDRGGLAWSDDHALRVVPAPAPAPTGRKLRHLFRRPPMRSVSDPPSYSYIAMDDGMRRPASEVDPAPREVAERRMPRLPSARNLLRKLT